MRNHGPVVVLVANLGETVGAVVGVAVGGAVWLAFAFRAVRLRDEGSPGYVGFYRWTGEQVRTRERAVAFVVFWAAVIVVANLVRLR